MKLIWYYILASSCSQKHLGIEAPFFVLFLEKQKKEQNPDNQAYINSIYLIAIDNLLCLSVKKEMKRNS